MIKLKNICIGYNGNNVMPSLSGKFEDGSITAIIGDNGVGKTTLLKTIAGLLLPTSGKLKFYNNQKPNVSYLSQQIEVNYHFPLTVFDVVSMGCWPFTNLFNKINQLQKSMIWQSLKIVKLNNIYNKSISVLSGGEFQRMLFARLLVQQSSLILLDEPFNHIDQKNHLSILSVIQKLHQNGSTIIAVLHDIKIIKKYCTNVLLLDRSYNIWGSTYQVLSQNSNLSFLKV